MVLITTITVLREPSKPKEEVEQTCISFRIHVRSSMKFENSAQLAAYYKWMNCVLSDAYYTAEKDYMTPDESFEMPIRNKDECLICSKKEEEEK